MAYRNAVTLNNVAVDLVCCGNTDEAIHHLNQAWSRISVQIPSGIEHSTADESWKEADPQHEDSSNTTLRRPCHAAHGATTSHAANESSHIDLGSMASVVLSSPLHNDITLFSVTTDGCDSLKDPCLEDLNYTTTSPHNVFAFYSRAIAIEVYRDEASAWSRCVPHIPAVLLYNAAFILHQQAMRTRAMPDFVRALDLYQKSLSVLQTTTLCGWTMDGLDILLLALVNNMGHCYSHLKSHYRAKLCLEAVCHLLQMSSHNPVAVTEEDYGFFRLSILFGSKCNRILAPAA
jgi:hypothetical protein